VQVQVATQKPKKRKLAAQHDRHDADPARHLLTLVKTKPERQKSDAQDERNGHANNVLARRKRKNVYARKTVYEKKSGRDALHARNVVLEKSKQLTKLKRKLQPKLERQNAASAGEYARKK
jgi:hypothetical protein